MERERELVENRRGGEVYICALKQKRTVGAVKEYIQTR